MNTLTKLTLTALAIATLAGCAAPLPKGSDTSKYLPTPVDVSKMKPVEMTLKAKNGDEYPVRRMLNEKSGEYFDTDGYSVNEQKFRVLKDGTVCQPTQTATFIPTNPFYSNIIDKNGNEVEGKFCLEKEIADKANNTAYAIGGVGALLGGPIVAASTAAGFISGTTVDAVNAVTADKTAE